MLACAEEYRHLKPKSPEAAAQLKKIQQDDALKELVPKVTGKLQEIFSMPAYLIALGYMLRMNEINQDLQEDLEYILSKATYLVEMMLQAT